MILSRFTLPDPGGRFHSNPNRAGGMMETKDLKKILAGFCIAGLISGSTFALSSCTASKSA